MQLKKNAFGSYSCYIIIFIWINLNETHFFLSPASSIVDSVNTLCKKKIEICFEMHSNVLHTTHWWWLMLSRAGVGNKKKTK